MSDRLTNEQIRQELVDMRAGLDIIKGEVAIKLHLGERQKAHFYKIMKFADWLATSWEYFQKIALAVGFIAGVATSIWAAIGGNTPGK
jgi:hypothetical protein